MNEPHSSPFPWADFFKIGFGLMRLTPHAFWTATPRELASAVQALTAVKGQAAPLERQALDQLMHHFPDGDKDEPR